MARIKIEDLPKDMKISKNDMRKITGGTDLGTYLEGLEDQLNPVGDDAQLGNIDMQNALQKQQQTIQMMSNISKVLHDTSMSVIRKMGG